MWVDHPGIYHVEEVTDDLVSALAQMCIKALASDVRDDKATGLAQRAVIDGFIMDGDTPIMGGIDQAQPTLRDALNKIIHGTPASVEVRDGIVWLNFRNSDPKDSWTMASFSGTQLLELLGAGLHKHRTRQAGDREREIADFIANLGARRFLPGTIGDQDAQTALLCLFTWA